MVVVLHRSVLSAYTNSVRLFAHHQLYQIIILGLVLYVLSWDGDRLTKKG